MISRPDSSGIFSSQLPRNAMMSSSTHCSSTPGPALRAARRAYIGHITALEGCCLSMDLSALLFDQDGNPLTGWQVGQVMDDIAELARMLAGGDTVVMAGVSDSGTFVDLVRMPSGGFLERTGAELMGALLDSAARHPNGPVAGWLKTLREEAEEEDDE